MSRSRAGFSLPFPFSRLLAVGVVVLVALGSAAPAEAAAGKRPRVVVRVSPVVQAVPDGTLAGAHFTVRNRTGARRAATRARVALVLRPGKVVRLSTTRVPALKAGRSVRLSAVGLVPARVPAGAYAVRVCVARPGRDVCRRSAQRSVVVGQANLRLDRSPALPAAVIGSQGPNQRVTVRNLGRRSSGRLAVRVTGPDASQFVVDGSRCISPLAAGAACGITASLRPTAPGIKRAVLSVSSASGGATTTPLTGQALAPAQLSLNRATVDLGDVVVGQSSATQVVVVTNLGDLPVQDVQIGVGGPQAGEITSTSTCVGALAPASSCTFTLQLTPLARGARSADLTVTGSSGAAVSASLTGTGLAPASFSVESALLTSTLLGQQSPTRDLTVTNTGDVPSGPVSAGLSSLDADQYAIVGSTCGAALAPAATCTLTIRFAPTERGYQSTKVVVNDDGATEGQGGVGGEGLAPAQLSISPLNTAFPITTMGEVSDPVTVRVTNIGDVPTARLLTTSFSLNGSSMHFRRVSDDCTFAVQPGDSCRVIVAFAPTLSASPGTPYSVTLSVGGAPAGTPVASFSGTAQLYAWMAATPSGRSFSNVVVGQQSAPQQFTFTNSGAVTSPSQTAGFIGTDPSQYAVTGSTCDTPVDPGGSCTVWVSFNPTSTGSKRARVVIVRPDGRIDTLGASLLATGVAPPVTP